LEILSLETKGEWAIKQLSRRFSSIKKCSQINTEWIFFSFDPRRFVLLFHYFGYFQEKKMGTTLRATTTTEEK